MRFFIFNIRKFIVNYLGRLHMSATQQKWIYTLQYPLIQLWETYNLWRRRQYYLVNITAQKISIENFLNDSCDKTLRRIFISSSISGSNGIFIALEAELQPFVEVSLESEGLPLEIGTVTDSTNNFIVNVPASLSSKENKILSDVNRVKTAGKDFTIVYF